MVNVRENHQNCTNLTVATASCCLLKAGGSFFNPSFPKVFVLKNIPAERVISRNWTPVFVFAGKEVWCSGVLAAQGVSRTLTPVPGCIVTQALYVPLTYVVSDPLTELSRCWILWLHCRRKVRTATPLCLHYSTACMDKCKSWLSSNRTAGLSLEGLACATKCFAYLIDDPPSSTQMNGPSVESAECTLCSMSVGEVLFRSACRNLLRCIAKI